MEEKADSRILDYLRFGYLPVEPPKKWREQFFVPAEYPARADINAVRRLFDAIMDTVVSKVPVNGHCIVPLSGGWDSRLLLAGVLDRLETRQIKTVSFGVPGQLDFDLGYQLGQSLGVESETLDLRSATFSWEVMVESARRAPWTYLPDAYFNDLSKSLVGGPNDVVVSGFLGNPTTLADYEPTVDSVHARERFLSSQVRSQSESLVPNSFRPDFRFESVTEKASFPLINVFDILVRQPNCTGPIVTGLSRLIDTGPVLGVCRATGGISTAPFTAPEWVNFWSNVPREMKVRRKLFLNFFASEFPVIFGSPTKYSLGAKSKRSLAYLSRLGFFGSQYLSDRVRKDRRRFKAKMNYIDYAECFRTREDYSACLTQAKRVIETAISYDLAVDSMLDRHLRRKADYSTEFLLIIGAAANFAAGHV